jgi:hypothetical protein
VERNPQDLIQDLLHNSQDQEILLKNQVNAKQDGFVQQAQNGTLTILAIVSSVRNVLLVVPWRLNVLLVSGNLMTFKINVLFVPLVTSVIQLQQPHFMIFQQRNVLKVIIVQQDQQVVQQTLVLQATIMKTLADRVKQQHAFQHHQAILYLVLERLL